MNLGFGEPQVAQDGRRSHHGGQKQALRIRHELQPSYYGESLRIRGGNTTDTKNYPYIAAIIINGRLWCAGTIVDVNWVLTAAHCLNL